MTTVYFRFPKYARPSPEGCIQSLVHSACAMARDVTLHLPKTRTGYSVPSQLCGSALRTAEILFGVSHAFNTQSILPSCTTNVGYSLSFFRHLSKGSMQVRQCLSCGKASHRNTLTRTAVFSFMCFHVLRHLSAFTMKRELRI
jgi:hypothetical protein